VNKQYSLWGEGRLKLEILSMKFYEKHMDSEILHQQILRVIKEDINYGKDKANQTLEDT
jgi:hypothetical protein